jgi:hypothetical protein
VEARRDVVAEIKIAPLNVLPWILGLALLALVILGATGAAHRQAAAPVHRPGAAAVDKQCDNNTPKLRQYA